MSITLNGTTGLAGTNGSAGTPAVQGEDTNTGIFFPAADTVAVATAGAERLRVDSSGNVGIGTSTASYRLNVAGPGGSGNAAIAIVDTSNSNKEYRIDQSVGQFRIIESGVAERLILSSGNLGLGVTPRAWGSNYRALDILGPGSIAASTAGDTFTQVANGSWFNGTNWIYQYTGIGAARYQMTGPSGGGSHSWHVAPSGTAGNAITFTQAMTLDPNRNLLVGATSTSGFATQTSGSAQLYLMGLTYHRNEVNTSGRFWYSGPEGSSGGTYLLYNANNTGVYLAYGGTSWSANSDERMKTTLVPFEDAVSKVCSLRAGTGRYLTDEEDVSRSFLIAQDVQAVLPEAVDVKEDEQGTLGLRYTDVVPLLVAAIKELKAEVDSLKAQLEAQ